MSKNDPAERTVRDIRRKTRKQYTAEEKIRIVVSGLRGEESIAALCRREGIAEGLYYSWSKEFLEAGKKRLAGNTGRQATSGEVKGLVTVRPGRGCPDARRQRMATVAGNRAARHSNLTRWSDASTV